MVGWMDGWMDGRINGWIIIFSLSLILIDDMYTHINKYIHYFMLSLSHTHTHLHTHIKESLKYQNEKEVKMI